MDTKPSVSRREVQLEHIRISTVTRGNLQVRIGFKDNAAVYGIYYLDELSGWVPAKWSFPGGEYNLNGRQSTLDLSIGNEWKRIK